MLFSADGRGPSLLLLKDEIFRFFPSGRDFEKRKVHDMPEMKNNILDYLDWRGDLSFSAAPFCEVDNLIFCMLSFADFSPAVSADPTGVPVKLSDVREAVREKYPSGEDFGEVVPKFVNELVDKALKSPRFREVYAAGFKSVLEESEITQFAAVTFVLPDNSLFVAYRGTDDTLVGWREDFCLSFTKPVRAQQLAAEYLADMASVYSGPVRVGGHSKGGNLAHYAAAFAPKHIRSRILTAYSNDGPGFLRRSWKVPNSGRPRARDGSSPSCPSPPSSGCSSATTRPIRWWRAPPGTGSGSTTRSRGR